MFVDQLILLVRIAGDDPFSPHRLNRIFDIAEAVITKHIPAGVPVYDDTESWAVLVGTGGHYGAIDSISGGCGKPGRTERAAEGVGPAARSKRAPDRNELDEWDDPLWEYLSEPALLAQLIREGSVRHIPLYIFNAVVSNGDAELVRIMLSVTGTALLRQFDPELSWTPLMYAVKNGDTAMAKLLIEAGSDVNAHDEPKIGDTALLLAVNRGDFEMAKLLVAHGADPGIPGWMQLTPLHQARDRKRMPALYDLLSQASRRT